MGEPRPGSRPGRRVTLTEAAELLGVSRDAVRMRVRRGSLASEKGEDERVYVFVEPYQDRAHPQAEDAGSSSPLVDAKDETISILREQLQAEREAHAEARRIIAALTQRIPELEPPAASEPSGGSAEAAEEPERVVPRPSFASEDAQEGSEKPWWRRVFGG